MKWIRISIPFVACIALIRMGELKTSVIAADPVAKTFTDCDVCPEMVVVAAGAFIMGSDIGIVFEQPKSF